VWSENNLYKRKFQELFNVLTISKIKTCMRTKQKVQARSTSRPRRHNLVRVWYRNVFYKIMARHCNLANVTSYKLAKSLCYYNFVQHCNIKHTLQITDSNMLKLNYCSVLIIFLPKTVARGSETSTSLVFSGL